MKNEVGTLALIEPEPQERVYAKASRSFRRLGGLGQRQDGSSTVIDNMGYWHTIQNVANAVARLNHYLR